MKTLKINLVAVIAILIGVGTMSFKMVSESGQQPLQWYIKNDVTGNWDIGSISTTPPTGCESIDQLVLCAKGFALNNLPDGEVHDGTDADDERFRPENP